MANCVPPLSKAAAASVGKTTFKKRRNCQLSTVIAAETNYFNIFFHKLVWGESSKTSIRQRRGDLSKSLNLKTTMAKKCRVLPSIHSLLEAGDKKKSLKFASNNLLRLFPLK